MLDIIYDTQILYYKPIIQLISIEMSGLNTRMVLYQMNKK